MIKYLGIAIISLSLSCRYKQPLQDTSLQVDTAIAIHAVRDNAADDDEEDETDTAGARYDYQDNPLTTVQDYPYIKVTLAFLKALKQNCHIWFRPVALKGTTINYFKKLALFGSMKDIYVIEADFHDGPMSEYPWKEQFIFDSNGRLLKLLNEVHLDTETVFPGSKPFLFGMSSTAKGNGGHEIFRIRKDTIEQVYDGFSGLRPNTYSTGYFNFSNYPHELYHTYSDANKDGYNDLVFYGKLTYEAKGSDDTIPVKYIFFYHPANGHFIEKEDYSKKYEYIYGDTK